MKTALMLFVAVILMIGLQGQASENAGAGSLRNWTGISGNRGTTIKANYVKTENGIVILNWTHNVNYQVVEKHASRSGTAQIGYSRVPTYNVRAEVHNKSKTVTDVVKVPLEKLSDVDRKWVESTDPDGTCMTKKFKVGMVGTLTPRFGHYKLDQRIDDDNAVISYINEGKTEWTFLLRSLCVSTLELSTEYRSIPDARVQTNEKRLPSKSATLAPVDFKRASPKKVDGKLLPVVEDN